MEREFLKGIDFNLYVDQETYESWRDLLKGLVMAKERDRRQWRRASRSQHRPPVRPTNTFSTPATRSFTSRPRMATHRARSTSPTETRSHTYAFEFTAPPHTSHAHHEAAPPIEYSPTPKPGMKRQATDAFSPTSESFADIRPLKRPTSMSLEIPQYTPRRSSSSISPLESLQSFSRMSLASSPNVAYTPQSSTASPAWISYARSDDAPRTLVAAYRVEKPMDMPQVRASELYSMIGTNIDYRISTTTLSLVPRWRMKRRTGAKPNCDATSPHHHPARPTTRPSA